MWLGAAWLVARKARAAGTKPPARPTNVTTTHELADTYTLTGVEDVTLGYMTRNHHRALSAHDAGLAAFRPCLSTKGRKPVGRLLP